MKRPGGRTSVIGKRVGAGVLGILESEGHGAGTHQAIATMTDVGRATLYRRWPTPEELLLFGILEGVSDKATIADTGSLEGDLTSTLANINAFLGTRVGRAVLLVSLAADADLKKSTLFWKHRSIQVEEMFEQARERGELPSGSKTEQAFAMAVGALYFSLFVRERLMDIRIAGSESDFPGT